MHSDSVMDERTLREMYLTNFELAIKEGKPGFVMTAYNRVNGVYANENRHLLGDILRGEWGFDGAVVTDWGGSNSIVEGVREGMNLEMPAAGDDSPCQLVKAVKDGTIDEKIIDERVDQLLDFVLAARKSSGESSFDAAKQHQAAEAAAEKCLVLLKNDEHLLPLKKDARVAVIGEFAARSRYQGAGSSMVNAAQVDDTLPMLDEFSRRGSASRRALSALTPRTTRWRMRRCSLPRRRIARWCTSVCRSALRPKGLTARTCACRRTKSR